MKAVGLYRYFPISHPESLLDVEVPKPSPSGRDLLVSVKAIAVNPVDTKVRAPKDKVEKEPRILGWDASGVVVEAGPECTLFKAGDEVYYAGSITRAGANSEFHLVDERIAGSKPESLGFPESAALPLTGITAWEALFERLGVGPNSAENGSKTLLVIGGAGGVGSIAIQLAKRIAGLMVIATASRPESAAWCKKMGADHVIDHSKDLRAELKAAGFETADLILCLNDTDRYFEMMAELVTPQGKICAIVGNSGPLDLNLLKNKSAAFAWEFMFTRSMYQTHDMAVQHEILNRISQYVEEKKIETTLTEVVGPINAENLKAAHARLEGGRVIGKLVLSGFD